MMISFSVKSQDGLWHLRVRIGSMPVCPDEASEVRHPTAVIYTKTSGGVGCGKWRS